MHTTQPPALFSSVSLLKSGRVLACLALCLLLAACGFRLKGASPLPFTTVYTNIEENSAFGTYLRRAMQASSPGLQFVNDPLRAQVQLRQLGISQNLRDISLDAQGRVEEYELILEFTFQVTDAQNRSILEPTTLRAVRELPYDDTIVQAKQGEIEVTFENMRQSLVERILYIMSSPDVSENYLRLAAEPVDGNLVTPEAGAAPAGAPASSGPATAPTQWGAPTPGINPGASGF
jgi:LPS-assembly lipoprotein